MSGVKVMQVALSGADRDYLTKVVSAGTHPARMIMRARVLLALDEDGSSVPHRAVVARRLGVSQTRSGSWTPMVMWGPRSPASSGRSRRCRR